MILWCTWGQIQIGCNPRGQGVSADCGAGVVFRSPHAKFLKVLYYIYIYIYMGYIYIILIIIIIIIILIR